ncbi:MAG: SH3 beta-barrel fold-containing protein [Bacteroidales bacterium]|nr:SH3 beta-barrel fold-containing protein [Bacteroidales bacterium]MDD6961109.1 SH3 beta-barrel fold-containing protein [Bacteroidales bacterium]MDY6186892.1 SH3 beta-barrel fold-containing protein [Muribaculaceae bacterium]
MKALTISTNSIVNNIVKVLSESESIDTPTAISKGLILETLKKRMMRGEVVRFCYQKLNGEIRTAVGTLHTQAVEANIAGTGIPKRFHGMFAYIDLEKMAWRGFKEERIIGIVD